MADTAAESLSARQASSLHRARLVATLLDDAVRIPVVGRRVGIESLLGLLPVGGDVVGGVLSLYVVVEAARCGVSKRTLARMLLNVGVDTAVGSVPLAGDLFDVFWKANRRNVSLLETHLGVDEE